MASNEIFTRWSWNMEWSNELLCSHCNVYLLPPCRNGSKNAAILVVEKVYDSYAINTGSYKLKNLTFWINNYILNLPTNLIKEFYMIYVYVSVLYCHHTNINCGCRNCRMRLSMAELPRNIDFHRGPLPHPFPWLLLKILLQKALQN